MLITQAQLKEYTARYNNLPDDVEAAYEKLLKNPTRLKVIRGALRIIKKHVPTTTLGYSFFIAISFVRRVRYLSSDVTHPLRGMHGYS